MQDFFGLDRVFVRVNRARWRCGKNKRSCSSRSVKNIYIDVSVISKSDGGTGIQRVVKSILTNLGSVDLFGWNVILLEESRRTGYYIKGDCVRLERAMVQAGDVFLGLDYALDAVVRHREQLVELRQAGCAMVFFVHDFLPIDNPEWFSSSNVVRFRKWMRVLAVLADGYFCNSNTTESNLVTYLNNRAVQRKDYWISVLPMGFEVNSKSGTACLQEPNNLLEKYNLQMFILAVGTVEPRKGYAELLNAFDRLWERDSSLRLVVVGRPGWKTLEIQNRMRSHPLNGVKFFWFDNLDDVGLEYLYKRAAGVIVASHNEGYGLPVIEALSRRCQVLARAIPVFLERSQPGLSYFDDDADSLKLSDRVENWIQCEVMKEEDWLPATSWRETCVAVIDCLNSRVLSSIY